MLEKNMRGIIEDGSFWTWRLDHLLMEEKYLFYFGYLVHCKFFVNCFTLIGESDNMLGIE